MYKRQELGELVETVLQNAYEGADVPPREILVPELPEDASELEQWLTARRHETSGGSVSDPTATRGRLSGRVELRTCLLYTSDAADEL